MKRVGSKLLMSTQTLAATGTVQADAAPITTAPQSFVLVTGANAAAGVLLPNAAVGSEVTIKNDDVANAVLKVWPKGTNAINALGASNALSMAAKTSATFRVGPNSLWYTTPLVPS